MSPHHQILAVIYLTRKLTKRLQFGAFFKRFPHYRPESLAPALLHSKVTLFRDGFLRITVGAGSLLLLSLLWAFRFRFSVKATGSRFSSRLKAFIQGLTSSNPTSPVASKSVSFAHHWFIFAVETMEIIFSDYAQKWSTTEINGWTLEDCLGLLWSSSLKTFQAFGLRIINRAQELQNSSWLENNHN